MPNAFDAAHLAERQLNFRHRNPPNRESRSIRQYTLAAKDTRANERRGDTAI